MQHAREDGHAPAPGAAPGANVPRLGKHVAALDGLRGLAILFVMNYHLAWAAPAVSLPAKVWVFFTTFGWTGVAVGGRELLVALFAAPLRAGGSYLPPASRAATALLPLKSPGRDVAAMGGLP